MTSKNHLHKVRAGRKTVALDTLALSLVALFAILVWFQSGLQITRQEMGFFFANPERWLYQTSHLWWDPEATGFANPQVVPFIPFQFAMLTLKTLGISDVAREAMVLLFLLAMSGVSMYLMTKSLTSGSLSHVTSLAAGLTYMFNPYALYLWTRFASSVFSYPFLPLFAFLFVRGIRAEKNLLRNALIVDLSLLLVLPALSNPYYLAPYGLVAFAIFLSFLLVKRDMRIRLGAIKFVLATAFLGVALNSWWLLPLFYYATTAYQTATVAINPLDTLLQLSAQYYLPLYVLRLFESFAFGQFVTSPFLSVVTILLPLVAFSATFFRRDRYTFFFLGLALVGIVLSVGNNPPFSGMFLLLFERLPFSGGLRAPYDKLGSIAALGLAYLVGITAGSVYTRLARPLLDARPRSVSFWQRKKVGTWARATLCFAMVGLAIFPSAVPMLSGSLWSPYLVGDPVKTKSAHVQVPTYYSSASEWLAAQGSGFRVISLPISSVDSFVYNWQDGYGGIVPWSLWPQPQVAGRTWNPTIDSITTQIQPFFVRGNQFYKVMEILAAKYVLVNQDFQLDESNKLTNPIQYITYLRGQGAPAYSNATDLVMNFTSWEPAQTPAHEILLDKATLIGGKPAVKVISDMQGDLNWEGGVQFTWPNSLNLSRYDYVSFWNKFDSLDSVARVYFDLIDSSGNYKKWEITQSVATSWNRITLPLNSAAVWQSSDNLILASISTIRITIEKTSGRMQTTTWWIGDFQAVPTGIVPIANIIESKTFGNLVFFQIKDDYFLPVIHASTEYSFSPDVRAMFQTLADGSVDPRNETIFLASQLSESDTSFIQSLDTTEYRPPQLSFREINPTEYQVFVSNATTPFFLVFSSTYDKNWFAYYDRPSFQLLLSEGGSSQYHFIANGYSNSWYIDRKGTYVITLYFRPQNLLYAGSAISAVSLILCLTFVARRRLLRTIRFVEVRFGRSGSKEEDTTGKSPSALETKLTELRSG